MHPRRRASTLRIAGWVLIVVFGAWTICLGCVVAWEYRDSPRSSSAIVVLGAAQYAGHPSPVLRARLDHAIELWRERLAPRLVLTGGRGEGDTISEAAVGRRYAIRRGVPDSAILIETSGRTTNESMRAVARMVAALPSRDVILVSDPFHMFRLTILARRLGMHPYTSPTHTSPIDASPHARLRFVLIESLKVPATLLGQD